MGPEQRLWKLRSHAVIQLQENLRFKVKVKLKRESIKVGFYETKTEEFIGK